MASRIKVEKTWRQIAAEVAHEDDPVKHAQLTRELTHALHRELELAVRQSKSRPLTPPAPRH
jgi:hypothetical protein